MTDPPAPRTDAETARQVAGSSDPDESLAAWVAARIEAGQPIDEGSYPDAHPEQADRLRRLAAAAGRIGQIRSGPRAEGPPAIGVLGDFRTIRELGRGGMGVVYEAEQLSLGRRVALKILPAAAADDPKRVRRFQVEARAADGLNHPHIVPVYLVGSEAGVHFFAMQLIEGRTLARVIADAERPSPRDAAELGRRAAEALHYAHEHGVIHRDVKPSNLMIDGDGHPWIADFGLARLGESSDLTATGDLVGTLRYASPEQALGTSAAVDHRTDVYSLGATLYEVLALRPAFEGDGIELLRRIADEEPTPLRRLDPTIPRDLETIVSKAMAKDPSRRYATARAMAEDLGRFLEGRPILARPPGAVDRAAKWAARHRPPAAAAVFCLVGLALAAAWRYRALDRHEDEIRSVRDRAERKERAIERAAYVSQWKSIQQAWSARHVETVQALLEELRPGPGRLDQRGFEWYLLRRLAHRDESILHGHEARVRAVAISPDGRTLASGDEGGWVILWDISRWRERGRVKAHPGVVHAIRFSPDGATLATVSRGGKSPTEIGLWATATASETGPLIEVPTDADVTEVAFSADGRTLVVAATRPAGLGSEAEVTFRDLARPAREVAPISCRAATIAPGGRWMAVVDASGVLTRRDPATGDVRSTTPGRFPDADLVALTADGRTVAVGRRRAAAVAFHDAETGRALGSAAGVAGRFRFATGGDRLVAASWCARGDVSLVRDAATNPTPVPLEGISGTPWCFAFSPDGTNLFLGGDDLPATVWDVATGRKLARYRFNTGVRDMAFARDGRSLIFGGIDGRIVGWRPFDQDEPVLTLAGHPAEVWALAYTPDGSTLISGADDHSIQLRGAGDGRPRATLAGHTALVASLAVSRDGKTLASAGFDRTVRLWDLPSGRPRAVLRGHTDRVRAVAFSPDGLHVASAGSDDTVRLWGVAGDAPPRVFADHSDTVRALAFHPSRPLLASSSDDRTIRIWDLASDSEPVRLTCPKHNAALAFSPDGTLLASGDDWGTVAIREVATWGCGRPSRARTPRSGASASRPTAGSWPPPVATRRSASGTRSPAGSPSSSTATPSGSTPWPSPQTARPSPPPATTAPSSSGAPGRPEPAPRGQAYHSASTIRRSHSRCSCSRISSQRESSRKRPGASRASRRRASSRLASRVRAWWAAR